MDFPPSPPFQAPDNYYYRLFPTNVYDWMVTCSHPKRGVCFKIGDKVVTNECSYFDKGISGTITEINPVKVFFHAYDRLIQPGIKIRRDDNGGDMFVGPHEIDLA